MAAQWLAYVLLFWLCGGSATQSSASNRTLTSTNAKKLPNILLILADDLGYGDLGFYPGASKSIKTPRLEEWSRTSAATMTNFHAAAAVCTPTRASIMTGLFPHRLGIDHIYGGETLRWNHFLARVPTLPEALRSTGYYTAHVGKWHLGALFNEDFEARRTAMNKKDPRGCPRPGPMQHGFDEFVAMGEDKGTVRYEILHKASLLYHQGSQHLVRNEVPYFSSKEILTDRQASEGIRVMTESVQAHRPFFLQVWFDAPHSPWEYIEQFLPWYTNTPMVDRSLKYATMVSSMDHNIGRLLDAVNQLGIAEDTLVVFMSDNGPEQGAGSTGHFQGRKRSVLEGGIAVPCMWQWGSKIPKRTLQSYAHSTDIFPTLVAAAGMTMPEHVKVDGRNLLPLLLGEEPDDVHSDAGLTHYWIMGGLMDPIIEGSAIRHAGFKLVDSHNGAGFLYDLYRDPTEMNKMLPPADVPGLRPNEEISWAVIEKRLDDTGFRQSGPVIAFVFRELRSKLKAFLSTRERVGVRDPLPSYDTCKIPSIYEVPPF